MANPFTNGFFGNGFPAFLNANQDHGLSYVPQDFPGQVPDSAPPTDPSSGHAYDPATDHADMVDTSNLPDGAPPVDLSSLPEGAPPVDLLTGLPNTALSNLPDALPDETPDQADAADHHSIFSLV